MSYMNEKYKNLCTAWYFPTVNSHNLYLEISITTVPSVIKKMTNRYKYLFHKLIKFSRSCHWTQWFVSWTHPTNALTCKLLSCSAILNIVIAHCRGEVPSVCGVMRQAWRTLRRWRRQPQSPYGTDGSKRFLYTLSNVVITKSHTFCNEGKSPRLKTIY